MAHRLFFVFFLLTCSVALGEDRSPHPQSVAGQSLEQTTALVNDEDRVIRLRAIRTLVVFGQPVGSTLLELLDHQDAAARYLAAQSLGDLGGEALANGKQRLVAMADADASGAVKMSVSYALCQAGEMEKYLPRLIESLDHVDRGTVCSAADLIGKLGPPAAAAVEALDKVYQQHHAGVKDGDYHRGGAAMNALRKIRGN
jgi:HEAT repeat protein